MGALQASQGVFLGKVVLQYLMDGIEADELELFVQKVNNYLSTELRGEVMTLAQCFEQRGRQQGMQE